MSKKRVVAREWIWFVFSVAFGLAVGGSILLVSEGFGLAVMIFFYPAVMLIRSIIWAYKNL